MHSRLRAAAENAVFGVTAAPYLLLDTNLEIVAVNPSYAQATMREAEELVGEFMFDAFPDNPADPGANGVEQLGISLERVLSSGSPHAMGLQRYDIPVKGPVARPEASANRSFVVKTWAPVNSPIIADGAVVGVLHHVEDVTEAHRMFSAADPSLHALFSPELRHALRVVSSASDHASPLGGSILGSPPGSVGVGPLLSYRDRIWHELVHAVRQERGHSCVEAVCEVSARLLPHIEGVAVTLQHSGRSVLQLAATNTWVRRAEDLQTVTGEGPAPTASATGRPSVWEISSLADARWPAYAEAASRWGVTATASYPLRAASHTFGTMTLYCRTTTHQLPSGAMASTLADVVAAVIQEDVDDQALSPAIAAAGFDEVNIAIGILVSRRGITTSDAEVQLRAAAYASDRTTVDIARDVIARHQLGRDDLL